MTELEKAKLMASLIGHNERMTLCGESTVLLPNYTAALRQALGCMNRVHGIDDPLLRALERDEQPKHPASSMILLRALRGYHSVGAMRQFEVDSWPDGEDCYLETIEEAIRCIRVLCEEAGISAEPEDYTDQGKPAQTFSPRDGGNPDRRNCSGSFHSG